MNSPFQRLENVLKGASGLVAVAPGVALLARAVQLPPKFQTLVGSLALCLGVAVVLSIYLLRDFLTRLSAKFVVILVLVTGVLGAIAGSFAAVFAMTHVITAGAANDTEDVVLVPLRPSHELDQLVAPLQYDWIEALASSSISSRVRTLMDQQSAETALLLTGSLLVAQTLLLTSLVTAAWKVAESLEQSGEVAD